MTKAAFSHVVTTRNRSSRNWNGSTNEAKIVDRSRNRPFPTPRPTPKRTVSRTEAGIDRLRPGPRTRHQGAPLRPAPLRSARPSLARETSEHLEKIFLLIAKGDRRADKAADKREGGHGAPPA